MGTEQNLQACCGTQKMSLTINSSGKQPILRLPQLSLLPLRLVPWTQTQWGLKILSRNRKDVPLIPVLQKITKESQNLYANNWEFRYMIFHFIVCEKKNKMTRYNFSDREYLCLCTPEKRWVDIWTRYALKSFFIFYILSIYWLPIFDQY